MSEITDYEVAKSIMDDNFIGVDELKKISQRHRHYKNYALAVCFGS